MSLWVIMLSKSMLQFPSCSIIPRQSQMTAFFGHHATDCCIFENCKRNYNEIYARIPQLKSMQTFIHHLFGVSFPLSGIFYFIFSCGLEIRKSLFKLQTFKYKFVRFILWKVLSFFMSNIKCMYVYIVFLIGKIGNLSNSKRIFTTFK